MQKQQKETVLNKVLEWENWIIMAILPWNISQEDWDKSKEKKLRDNILRNLNSIKSLIKKS